MELQEFEAAAADECMNLDSDDLRGPAYGGRGTQDLLLLDVTPTSIGFAHTCENTSRWVIPRNTTIPCRKTMEIWAPMDDCDAVDLIIIEGLFQAADRNTVLKKVSFSFPSVDRGTPVGEVAAPLPEVFPHGARRL